MHANVQVQLGDDVQAKIECQIAAAVAAFDNSLAEIRNLCPQKD